MKEKQLIVIKTKLKLMDGGYYAIKGFEYQIDKSILEVLSCSNVDEEIFIEQIQDINTNSFVIQVKYKEASKLVPSRIREPIIQLINEFIKDSNKYYILYCYFYDLNGYSDNVDLNFLNTILGIEREKYTPKSKNEFLLKFKLIFSETFHDQFQNALVKLQEFNFCNSKEEAIYYYSILADYLRKKVVENPPSQIELRKVSKKEISEHLEKGRKIVFTSSFKEYKGEQFYFKFLKDQFVKPHKNQDIFIIVGNIIETPNLKIESLILKIILKHYEKATYDIKPLNFIISDSKIVEVKKNLLREKCPYNDGYETIEFNEKLFFSPPIINRKISGKKVSDTLSKTSFQSRILTKTNFDQLTEINGNPMWIILEEEKHILIQNTSYQIIKNLNTDQILKLF